MSYPEELDVFMTLLDGFHPIVASDHNVLFEAVEKVEEALGYGENIYGGGGSTITWGPKGPCDSVAARLNKFLDSDGQLKGIFQMTGTCPAGQFSKDDGGKYFPFPKDILEPSDTGFVVLLQCAGEYDSANGAWNGVGPGAYCVQKKGYRHCEIWGFSAQTQGNILASASQNIDWQILVIGNEGSGD